MNTDREENNKAVLKYSLKIKNKKRRKKLKKKKMNKENPIKTAAVQFRNFAMRMDEQQL